MLRSPKAPVAVLALMLLLGPTSHLAAQAQERPAVAAFAPAAAPIATPAQVTPEPRPSPLFQRDDDRPTTLAAAELADAEARASSGRHTITMSTTVLILAIVILVLLID